MSSYDDIVRNADEIQRRYEEWKAGSLTPQKPQVKEVVADQDGIDKNKVFKIKTITGDGSSDPNFAIDGKASTAFKGSVLTAELEGVGKVKAIGLKFGSKPDGDVKIEGKYDPATWNEVMKVSEIKSNEFKYHVLPKAIPSQSIKISGDLDVINVQILDTDPVGQVQEPPEEPPVTPEQPPTTGGDGPYASIGQEMQSTTRGPTTRHYASGKPDDRTIEKNVKDIRHDNYQFLVDVKVTTIEHNDTVSLKYGGTHMGSGWFDNTIDFESGQVGLGTEEEHPGADLEIIKGDKIGSILNKKIRIAGVYFKKINRCEMWTNLGSGWKMNAEGVNVGGFNPKSTVNEAQLRIDGFEAVPEISRAVVQPISPKNS